MRHTLSSLGLTILVALGSASKSSDVVLCEQYQNFTTSSGQYTFGTNQWGDDGSGSECVTISNDGTVFNSTWSWSRSPLAVHSFPNINLNSDLLPIQLSNLSALNITANWSMAPSPSKKTKGKGLSAINAAADVVVDMFLDPDRDTSNSTTLPKYEVMVWIGAAGGKKPIGFSSSITNPPVETLGDTVFTLYMGANGNGQFVYSWLAPNNIGDFDEDISPLLHYLWRSKYISESNYLGIVQFGTETFHSSANVTFSAQDFNMSVHPGEPQAPPLQPSASASTTATPKSIGSLHCSPKLTVVVIATFSSWVLSV